VNIGYFPAPAVQNAIWDRKCALVLGVPADTLCYSLCIVRNPVSAIQALWILWFVSWMAAAVWSNPSAKRPVTGRELPYRLIGIAGIVLLAGLYPHQFSSERILWRTGPVLGWSMVAVAAAGFMFMWWARIFLGRLWSSGVSVTAKHRVIDSGPYGVVRHPIYTGIIVAGLATAAIRGTVAGFLGATLMTVSWYIKAREEERFLREQLGLEAYDAYARRVPMLVPFM
jgi:protein-S-isoprenylcysteine O-methyltransferase Ste14